MGKNSGQKRKQMRTDPPLTFMMVGSFATMEQAQKLDFSVNEVLAVMHFPIGLNLGDTANLKGIYDTGGCCNIGEKAYHLTIAKQYPQLVKQVYDFPKIHYVPIKVGGIEDSVNIEAIIEYYIPLFPVEHIRRDQAASPKVLFNNNKKETGQRAIIIREQQHSAPSTTTNITPKKTYRRSIKRRAQHAQKLYKETHNKRKNYNETHNTRKCFKARQTYLRLVGSLTEADNTSDFLSAPITLRFCYDATTPTTNALYNAFSSGNQCLKQQDALIC
ncbi:unnamed protein product [Cylindrotheca closterium]|uniref:Uncharacterized protein n=1 Tax=Cylindrotheca closterium TaxID=2856 RepID=A0AAD2JM69_9STRA|nr:unnamed protein product [Cylindrotheca closterium]